MKIYLPIIVSILFASFAISQETKFLPEEVALMDQMSRAFQQVGCNVIDISKGNSLAAVFRNGESYDDISKILASALLKYDREKNTRFVLRLSRDRIWLVAQRLSVSGKSVLSYEAVFLFSQGVLTFCTVGLSRDPWNGPPDDF